MESQAKKRPSTGFMEKVQKDINPSMRAILVDWLVEVMFIHSQLVMWILHSLHTDPCDVQNWHSYLHCNLPMMSYLYNHFVYAKYLYSNLQVAEEYRLVPDTLYLTVNYIDRYLSGNVMNRQKLQLLGVASMMIAS